MAPFGSNKVEPERLQTSLLSWGIISIIWIYEQQYKIHLEKLFQKKKFLWKKKNEKSTEIFEKMTSDLATRERNNC